MPKARRSASLVAHKHFGAAVSRTAQLLVLILDSVSTKFYATCSVSYRYFMHKYLFVPQSFPDTIAVSRIQASTPISRPEKLPPLASVSVSHGSFALSRYSYVFSANVAWEIPYKSASLLSILLPFSPLPLTSCLSAPLEIAGL